VETVVSDPAPIKTSRRLNLSPFPDAVSPFAADTKRTMWAILQRFRDEHGSKRMAPLRREHVLAILEGRPPFARRNWLHARIGGLAQKGSVIDAPRSGLIALQFE
jgi:hypothetical protein